MVSCGLLWWLLLWPVVPCCVLWCLVAVTGPEGAVTGRGAPSQGQFAVTKGVTAKVGLTEVGLTEVGLTEVGLTEVGGSCRLL